MCMIANKLVCSLLLASLLLPAGSSALATTPASALTRVTSASQPYFFDHADKADLRRAVEQSLGYLAKLPPERHYRFGDLSYSVAWMQESLRTFLVLLERARTAVELHAMLTRNFDIYQSGGQGQVMVTGYYEPLVRGSLRREGPYLYPLYRKPGDLASRTDPDGQVRTGRLVDGKMVPYWSRQEIDGQGVLAGQELVFLADPVDAFVMHVQGSGRIELPDGRVRQISYAAKNGRPYASIGKYLVDQGLLAREEASLPGIRRYLRENSGRRHAILNQNESYVFFKWGDEICDGPTGCLGASLTPLRSVALDQSFYPPGALAFLETWQPKLDGGGRIVEWQPLSLFVLNQDSGSAIKGPGRVDLFWGAGDYAETAAGHMSHDGYLYFLVKKRY